MARPAATFWLATPSRYAALGRTPARIVAALLLVLLIASFSSLRSAAPPPRSPGPIVQPDDKRDVLLYASIVDALRHGEGYYPAAARSLRAGDYPLRPFFTFRLPTLALVQSRLPTPAIVGLLYALVALASLCWAKRLDGAMRHRRATAVSLGLLAMGLPAFVQAELWPFHEIWAGLLIALSLALRRPGHYTSAVAIGLVAALVRETSGLYLLIMAASAWRDGHRREALAWSAAIAGVAAALAAHAVGVAQVTGPLDPQSPGWSGLLGFGFFVNAVRACTGFATLPQPLAAPLIALALFGWTAWRDPLAMRVAATLCAYAVFISLFARADTFYWTFLVAPLLPVGLAFAVDGIRDLWRSAFDRPTSTTAPWGQ